MLLSMATAYLLSGIFLKLWSAVSRSKTDTSAELTKSPGTHGT
jgi:hypothetical protein